MAHRADDHRAWRGPGLGLLVWLLLPGLAAAGEVAVAVAANFRAPLTELAAPFEAASGHRLRISAGSTGQLFAQIVQGAPFDVFLAADQARPEAAVRGGHALGSSRFTYAEGRLYVLLRAPGGRAVLRDAGRLSLANPRTAPYGAAAMQVVRALGLTARIAQAQSVAGVNAAFAAGAVDAGFAAYSSVAHKPAPPTGWLVPRGLHDPIRQDAVLLRRGARHAPARAFLDWLQGDEARALIRGWGYD